MSTGRAQPKRGARFAPRFSEALLVASLLAWKPACTYENEPGLRPVARGELTLLRSEPPLGSTDVAVDTAIDLYFDQALDADTVTGSAVRLVSGRIGVLGRVKTDLISQRVRLRPDGLLRAELEYQVYVGTELRGLDGAALVAPYVIGFVTGRRSSGEAPDEVPPVGADGLQPLWNKHCTRCHAQPAPAAGVDLSAPAAALRTMRSVTSLAAPLPRVAPGDHARSYLMRKLLGTAGISGFSMPPDAPRLAERDLRRVADWIDGGARERALEP